MLRYGSSVASLCWKTWEHLTCLILIGLSLAVNLVIEPERWKRPATGNLTRWAEQGVLLLNATLTVRAHQAGSHQNRGWEAFTAVSYTHLNIGGLLYFFEKACGISGYLLGVNPFNQPGVEAYKKNMFALLNILFLHSLTDWVWD